MSRPRRLVLVAGTGTEIGKTWVAAEMLRCLRASGHTVHARKPAQSFEVGPDGPIEPTDADVLGAAAGLDPFEVCPTHRWYETPMAPPMAAASLGRPVPTLLELADELTWPDPAVDVGLVETAGGVRSPLAADGDTVDLAEAIAPDAVVLVADARLGTINLVRLCSALLQPWPFLVLLNRFLADDPLQAANREWLEQREDLRVEVDPRAAATFALHP